MKTTIDIAAIIIDLYKNLFNDYNEDALDNVLDQFYIDNNDIDHQQRIEIWKIVSESLKNNL